VVRTSSKRLKQHLKVRDAQIGLHNCITFRNKTLTNSNKISYCDTASQYLPTFEKYLLDN